MAPEYEHVGTVEAEFSDALDVHRDPGTGDVRLALRELHPSEGREHFTWVTPAQLGELRELLDRAAMPGQVT